MTDVNDAIANIEQLVADYAEGTRNEDAGEEFEHLLSEVTTLVPKTTQVAALVSQIKHLAPIVFKLRAQERYTEIEMGKRRLLEDCERLREVVAPKA